MVWPKSSLALSSSVPKPLPSARMVPMTWRTHQPLKAKVPAIAMASALAARHIKSAPTSRKTSAHPSPGAWPPTSCCIPDSCISQHSYIYTCSFCFFSDHCYFGEEFWIPPGLRHRSQPFSLRLFALTMLDLLPTSISGSESFAFVGVSQPANGGSFVFWHYPSCHCRISKALVPFVFIVFFALESKTMSPGKRVDLADRLIDTPFGTFC